MRKINKIVIHHSYTGRDIPLAQSLRSFNRTHHERLVKGAGMPLSKIGSVDSIAYHYVIAGNGDYAATRQLSDIGYHASNWQVNKESIGICITGNFDEEYPTEEQYKTLFRIIGGDRFKGCTIHTHHEFKPSKSCPGKNVDMNRIKNYLNKLSLNNKNMDDSQKQLVQAAEYIMKAMYNYGTDEMKKLAAEVAPKLRELK